MMKIIECTIVCASGGCYVAFGEISIDGVDYGFYGDIQKEYAIMSVSDLKEMAKTDDFSIPFEYKNPVFYLNNETSKNISKKVIEFKKNNGMTEEDNYIIEECERIIKQ